MSSFQNLFSPFSYRRFSSRNRIVMSPMSRYFSKSYIPGTDVVEYYRRRAAGGVGLLISEGTTIDHPAANGYEQVPCIHGNAAQEGWKAVVAAVHAEGGKMLCQLWHVGAYRNLGTGPDPEVPACSPSGLLAPEEPNGRTMSEADIADVVESYAVCAENAQAVGFDGIEIHGGHGYLIDQFFWDATNLRNDRYGGPLAQRTRFATEVIAAIRKRVGPLFLISFRWSQWKQQDYKVRLAHSPADLEQLLQPLADAGADIFHCSARRFWEPEFVGSDLSVAGWAKKITGKPTIAVGNIGLALDERPKADSPETILDMLERKLAEGEFDLAAVGRALIANSDWPLRIQERMPLVSFQKEMLKELL